MPPDSDTACLPMIRELAFEATTTPGHPLEADSGPTNAVSPRDHTADVRLRVCVLQKLDSLTAGYPAHVLINPAGEIALDITDNVESLKAALARR